MSNENFAISAIPHTVQVTILKDKKVGDVVNLENDIIGKYVERLISFGGGVVECHNQSLKIMSHQTISKQKAIQE